MEKYDDESSRNDIKANCVDNRERDLYLEGPAKKWIVDLEAKSHGEIRGALVPLVSQDRRKLTHRRVQTLRCGGKTLSIYPDDGFINAWVIQSRPRTEDSKFFTKDNTDTTDVIELLSVQDVKFDVDVE